MNWPLNDLYVVEKESPVANALTFSKVSDFSLSILSVAGLEPCNPNFVMFVLARFSVKGCQLHGAYLRIHRLR